ncbi:NHL repeat-containing protein 2 [Durusdinium trenchii]|uniref:NHL repeat-containing protein 2 n=1 Tax=Durusdinium trenchii TaxID=1381693 RepID=A0ABP0JM44_9DINO
MTLVGNTLYVADTENHLIRTIDLEAKQVATLAGTGVQARRRIPGGPLRETALNSPWDLLELNGVLYIAMAGPHQLWKHDLGSNTVEVYAGSGREDILDGPRLNAALAQPSGLTTDGKVLYLVDSEGSAVRRVELGPEGSVTTLVGPHDLPQGRSLFTFDDVDGVGDEVRLQHPIGLVYHEGSIYVADSYNHKVKKIDVAERSAHTWIGTGSPGTSLDPAELNEPAGMTVSGNQLIVADTNNHRLLAVDLVTKETREFVIEGLAPPTPTTEAAEDDTASLPITEVPAQQLTSPTSALVKVKFDLPEGFKLNQLAPVVYRVESPASSANFVTTEVLGKRKRAESDEMSASFEIPLTGAGKGSIDIIVSYQFCRDGTGGVCRFATQNGARLMAYNANRRDWLKTTACGFGSLALAGLCQSEASASASANPYAAQAPMFTPRAKRVIFIFMQGGPSQVDTFDYKPALDERDGEKIPFRDARKMAKSGKTGVETIMKPFWRFRQYGESGKWVSDLFPHIGQQVDNLCFLHSLHTNGVAHGPSTLFLHTGATALVRPSVGAWVSYGLGTENQNLPAFVTISPSAANGGPRNYSNAFLPTHHQGTAIGRAGQSAAEARIKHVTNPQLDSRAQQEQFELLRSLNAAQMGRRDDERLNAVTASYELAWRMQQHAPNLTDLSRESRATQELYGIGDPVTDDFGRQCLMARRFAEAGVRYVQINYGDNTSNPRWDQHSKMQRHEQHARATDRPVAALLTDLKARGLLEDTLVWWGGEFGRNPFTQGNDGRDHNPKGFTHFLAGGGVKAGFSYGETDEFGHEAVVNKIHMHDLHATVLHLLGLDHERLTYRFAGRDFRLTDVEGRVVHDIFA